MSISLSQNLLDAAAAVTTRDGQITTARATLSAAKQSLQDTVEAGGDVATAQQAVETAQANLDGLQQARVSESSALDAAAAAEVTSRAATLSAAESTRLQCIQNSETLAAQATASAVAALLLGITTPSDRDITFPGERVNIEGWMLTLKTVVMRNLDSFKTALLAAAVAAGDSGTYSRCQVLREYERAVNSARTSAAESASELRAQALAA